MGGAEYAPVVKVEFLLYILGHARGCRGGECQHGNVRQGVAYLGNLQVGGAEVVAPLRNAVCLVNDDKRDRQPLDAGREELGVDAFG